MQRHRSSRTFLCRQLTLKGNPEPLQEGRVPQTQVGHGGGLLQASWWSVAVGNRFARHFKLCPLNFLTFKCWTCCFKHLCILEVQGVASCLADFPPLALLPVVFRLLLRLATKVFATPLEGSVTLHLIPDHTFCCPTLPPIFSVWCQREKRSSVTVHPGFKQLLCLDRLGSSFNEPSSKEMQISWVTFAKRKRILFEVPLTVTSQCFFF